VDATYETATIIVEYDATRVTLAQIIKQVEKEGYQVESQFTP